MRVLLIAGVLFTVSSCAAGPKAQSTEGRDQSTLSDASADSSKKKKDTTKYRYDEKSGATLVYDSAQPEIHTCKDELLGRFPKQWRAEGRWLDSIIALSKREVLKYYKGINSADLGASGYEYYHLNGCVNGNDFLGCVSWVNVVVIVNVKSNCRTVKRFLDTGEIGYGDSYYEPVDSLPPNN
jgi:hypothetical protein